MVKRYFSAYVQSGDAPLDALAKALQMALYTFTYSNNTPSDFVEYAVVEADLLVLRGMPQQNAYL